MKIIATREEAWALKEAGFPQPEWNFLNEDRWFALTEEEEEDHPFPDTKYLAYAPDFFEVLKQMPHQVVISSTDIMITISDFGVPNMMLQSSESIMAPVIMAYMMRKNEENDEIEIEMVHVEGNEKIESFQIGKYPVTQKQWRNVMGDNPSHFKDCDDCPVELVSWNDVQKFIKKLNQKTGSNYRLPTEAEWEYAARGGKKSQGYMYAGSNNLDEVGWYNENAGSKTHPVGQKKFNEIGLYDVSGNVWEWCENQGGTHRVRRGGGWVNDPQYCRVSSRYFDDPADRRNNIGFRLAL